MHIKRRGDRAMLYRSSWVPKGTAGNTHGYSTQAFVGSLPLYAECLPSELENKFSSVELNYLDVKIFEPARHAGQQKVRAVELREADPIWRLDEAARLTFEAAERSEMGLVPDARVTAVQTALARVKTISQALSLLKPSVQPTPVEPVAPVSPVVAPGRDDPLRVALIAIKAARDAVLAGRYGTAPVEGVRATYAYRTWAEIYEAIEGGANGSLLRALQSKGFAKTRAK